MAKKLLIILTIIILLAVSTTPALAKKPAEPNGKGLTSREDHQSGNSLTTDVLERKPADPASKKSALLLYRTEKLNRANHKNGHGFDEAGYNRTARIFNGIAEDWCMEKFGWTEGACEVYLGIYAHDKLVMKWNAEWDLGNEEEWAFPPYDAWENNQWNGNTPGGSGEVWHYKIVWVGNCVSDPSLVPAGGYCIWGQFATIMDQGTSGGEHFWFAHALPTGYGFYP